MCIFHKWEKVKSKENTLVVTSRVTYQSREVPTVIVLEKCKKCGKERAYYVRMDERTYIEVEYAKIHL